MTHTEKLSELTARIREALPRLKEIQRGYKFLHIPNKRVGISFEYEVLDVYGGIQIADTGGYSDSYCTVISGYDGVEDGWLYEDVEEKEIIGCEPMLNDVLEYRKKTLSATEDLSSPFCLILMMWDLTKPYLKNQSKELIDYLWGLKK